MLYSRKNIQLIPIISLFLSLFLVPLWAAKLPYTEGRDYIKVSSKVSATKSQVTEYFWYGCPGCYQFQPFITAWHDNLPDNIRFLRMPAVWNETTRLHAQMYYVAEALGLEGIHNKIFDAFHKQNKRFATVKEIKRFFISQGINGEHFDRVFNSFGVTHSLQQAQAKARKLGTRGTPELIINDRYRITTRTAGSFNRMLMISDYLLQN